MDNLKRKLGALKSMFEYVAVTGLDDITSRFHGFDLQRRKDWVEQWRARIHTNKNERDDYRLTAYGSTPQEAIYRLLLAVKEIDAKFKKL